MAPLTARSRRYLVVALVVAVAAVSGAAIAASAGQDRDVAGPSSTGTSGSLSASPDSTESRPPTADPTSTTPTTAPPTTPPARSPSDDTEKTPKADEPPAPAPAVRAPSLAGFPTAATTGVPAGTNLTPSGSITITEPGTVIDSLLITGTVTVKADDVQIKRTLILAGGRQAIRLDANNLLVEDTEIDGQGGGGPAVGLNDYVLRRVNIHSVAEGPRIAGGDVVIEDSYIHDIAHVGSNHADAVQIVGGDNITLRGNTIDVVDHTRGTLGNAAIQMGEEDGEVSACLVERNLLNGGNYTVNAGGGGSTGAECTFDGNVFQRDSRYGPAGNLGRHIQWSTTNVWFDTGLPVIP